MRPRPSLLNAVFMLSTWPRTVIVLAGRELRAKLIDDLCHLVGNAAEIGALHVRVNVEHWLDVAVTLHRRRFGTIK